ncbi:SusC/RagA family TonB-linked outer membrane protein [Sphingobacterium sp. MYb382]|uniref:SusC/RagA family TonB-linked outer membrane protein n=1 Tax=Sphingobacterium sp. MYb382 TaxID=2745278 RepID=UPI0030EB184A
MKFSTFSGMKKVCLTSLSLFSMTVAASLQAHAGATNFTTFANPANTAVQKTFGTATRNQQQETIRGIVLDNEGNPLAGVTIREEDGRTTTSSNANGAFELRSAVGKKLIVTYVGYKTQVVSITKANLQITLEANADNLDEVVVIGYGTQTKKDLTGSVAQLDAKNFRQGAVVSADNLLQGKVAGVRVVSNSGEPGGGVDVTIRGVGSIRSGSTPLFVIDGVPLNNDNVSPGGQDIGLGSSRSKNPLNFLNTSDIESISVLKDASAAAIYGARGSNGVVIITTKKAKKGEASLTADSYLGFSSVAKKIDVMSADEYRNAIKDKAFDHGSSTDWQDVIFRNAQTRNHSLSFAKATTSGNYYVSAAQMDQEGIVKNSDFRRTSARVNASEGFLDNQRLLVGVNLTVSETRDQAAPTSDNGGSNGQLIAHALMANPTRSVFDENGNYTNFKMNAHYNPAYLLDIYRDNTRTLRALANLNVSFRIIDGLAYKLNLGFDRAMAERNTTIFKNDTDLTPNGRFVKSNQNSKNTILEHYLNFNKTFAAHKLEAIAGFSYQKFENGGNGYNIEGVGRKGEGILPENNPGSAGRPSTVNGTTQENELQSYFGRINYGYDNRYMLTASVRADGSTRFGDNNKYGTFPSFAAGWNITNEKFLQFPSWLNELKLRGSWGVTGNQEVPNRITKASYAYSPTDGYYLNDDLNLVNGISVKRTPYPDLKWERVIQTNVGLDFSLFQGKLYGTLEYFNKITKDAILNIPSQPLSSTSDIWLNIDGSIVNKGFEFMLGSQLVNKPNFKWSVDLNGATLHNTLKDLPISEILSGSIAGPGQSGVNINIYKSNYAIGSFYLPEYKGVNDKGLYEYSADRQVIGGAMPKFTFGFNNSMSYKAFDLGLSFMGQLGGYNYNNLAMHALNINNLASDRNVSNEYYAPNISSANNPQISSLYLEKSDFLRLNSARLGYTFSSTSIKWAQSIGLYVTGQNLWTLTKYSGYDPLINSPRSTNGNQSLGLDYSAFPAAKTILFGVTVKL